MNDELHNWSQQFVIDILPVLESAMLAVACRQPVAEIAGIGISTDSDATSVVAFANSRSNLERLVAGEPEFILDYTWNIGEWDLDLAGPGVDDPLVALRHRLERARPSPRQRSTSSVGVPGMGEFRRAVWNAIARAMAESAREGFFDRWPSAAKIFMPLDADVSEAQLVAWNTPLNEESQAADLRSFLGVAPGSDR